jgi:hypothetical protein
MSLYFCSFSTNEHADICSVNDSQRFQLQNYLTEIFKNKSKVDKSRPQKQNPTNTNIRLIECTI